MLSKHEIIESLKHHNEWRRGAEIEMMNPTDLGEIIDGAIKLLESSDNGDYAKCKELADYLISQDMTNIKSDVLTKIIQEHFSMRNLLK